MNARPKVVIIGGGFGGLTVAKQLKDAPADITLIDKTNHHLFQPLLYQVATAALSPGDIASPLRSILKNQKNTTVLKAEVVDISADNNFIELDSGEHVSFDYLVVAAGARHSYFGNDAWERDAPGLKTVSDALFIRERMLETFEEAELHGENKDIEKYLTFVIVGGGPTGVELAGAIAEMANCNMHSDFRRIDTSKTKVILVEASPTVLGMYPDPLPKKAIQDLTELGVEVLTETRVMEVTDEGVATENRFIESKNVIWAAGNTASPLIKTLPVSTDRGGRALVEQDCSVPDHSNIFVIGDAAAFQHGTERPLPGVALVALQQAEYVAGLIKKHVPFEKRKPFVYKDLGSMATIGRARAIAMVGNMKFSGFVAWLLWSLVHIVKIISFRNRYKVMAEWFWFYITYRNGIRLITNMRPKAWVNKSSKDKDLV